jgi:hypothetical protein
MEPERSGWARCCGSREGVAVDAVDDNAVLGAGDGRDGLMKPPPPPPPPTPSMLGFCYIFDKKNKDKNIFPVLENSLVNRKIFTLFAIYCPCR